MHLCSLLSLQSQPSSIYVREENFLKHEQDATSQVKQTTIAVPYSSLMFDPDLFSSEYTFMFCDSMLRQYKLVNRPKRGHEQMEKRLRSHPKCTQRMLGNKWKQSTNKCRSLSYNIQGFTGIIYSDLILNDPCINSVNYQKHIKKHWNNFNSYLASWIPPPFLSQNSLRLLQRLNVLLQPVQIFLHQRLCKPYHVFQFCQETGKGTTTVP